MTVQRGGRDREKAEAQNAAVRKEAEVRKAQHALDTRALAANPAFRRWLAYWLDRSDVLTVPEPTTPHDALRAQLGKQYLGMQMLNDVQAMDPSFVTELWTTTQEAENV